MAIAPQDSRELSLDQVFWFPDCCYRFEEINQRADLLEARTGHLSLLARDYHLHALDDGRYAWFGVMNRPLCK